MEKLTLEEVKGLAGGDTLVLAVDREYTQVVLGRVKLEGEELTIREKGGRYLEFYDEAGYNAINDGRVEFYRY